jgi:hypothetical protein
MQARRPVARAALSPLLPFGAAVRSRSSPSRCDSRGCHRPPQRTSMPMIPSPPVSPIAAGCLARPSIWPILSTTATTSGSRLSRSNVSSRQPSSSASAPDDRLPSAAGACSSAVRMSASSLGRGPDGTLRGMSGMLPEGDPPVVSPACRPLLEEPCRRCGSRRLFPQTLRQEGDPGIPWAVTIAGEPDPWEAVDVRYYVATLCADCGDVDETRTGWTPADARRRDEPARERDELEG